jgi:hypothetical protein
VQQTADKIGDNDSTSWENILKNCGTISYRGCEGLGVVDGDSIFYLPLPNSYATAFFMRNGTLIIMAPSYNNTGSLPIKVVTQIVRSLKPMSTFQQIDALLFHYQGGLLTHDMPGNSLDSL